MMVGDGSVVIGVPFKIIDLFGMALFPPFVFDDVIVLDDDVHELSDDTLLVVVVLVGTEVL